MQKKLVRSKKDKMIAGVGGGLAEYFDMDSSVMRLIIIAVSLPTFPFSIIAYFVAALVIPTGVYEAGNGTTNSDDSQVIETESDEEKRQRKDKTRFVLGVTLVIVGIAWLSSKLLPWFGMKYFWPVVLIGIGIGIIYKGRGE